MKDIMGFLSCLFLVANGLCMVMREYTAGVILLYGALLFAYLLTVSIVENNKRGQ